MKTRMLAIGLALLTFFASSPFSLAQDTAEPPRGWDAVKALPTGDKLSVKLKNGKSVEGNLFNVSETTLTLSRGSDTIDLKRDDIQKIFRVRGRSRAKSALIGAGIGGATGTGVGLALYIPARDDLVGSFVPATGLLGAGIGAGIGAAFGSGRKRTLVYDSVVP